MALFSDWLQGPYVYKLYAHYGYASNQIAILYVVGFASSVVFGTFTGPLADKFGRKQMALCFCAIYSFCCLTKLSSSFFWLFLGRVFGGISTSMLFSTFESWYVCEHTETYDFPSEWISVTLSKATFWNGLLAINAGIIANVFAETFEFGPVAPFMLAIPFLIVSGLIIAKTWRENYGNSTSSTKSSAIESLRTILFKEEILYLGIAQSLFEANMYIFVFQWTPILDDGATPLGMVFATFMVCIMIGSSLYTILLHLKYSQERLLTVAMATALAAMLGCAGAGEGAPQLTFVAFLALEVAVGLYFPAIGSLRSQVIPEEQRASIMNWFRVPMNVVTCGALLWGAPPGHMFLVCAALLLVACGCCLRFCRVYASGAPLGGHATPLLDGADDGFALVSPQEA